MAMVMGERSKSPDQGMYMALATGEESTLVNETIAGVGTAFSFGTVGASLYHMCKAVYKERSLVSGINAACTYGPRFGGTLTLVTLPVGFAGYAIHQFRGGGPRGAFGSEWLDEFGCCAASGALLRAPRGLGSALRAAAFWASVPAAFYALQIYLENSDLCNTQRPYSYPHYRLEPQDD